MQAGRASLVQTGFGPSACQTQALPSAIGVLVRCCDVSVPWWGDRADHRLFGVSADGAGQCPPRRVRMLLIHRDHLNLLLLPRR